jgi:hypothetical protein
MERAEAEAIYEHGREAVVAVLLTLAAQVEAQDARIAKLTARIEELERRLRRDSHNSSTPPSQDPPGARERKRTRSPGRRQGGQPGHLGHGRSFQPIASVDELIDHWPESCACGHRFRAAERCPVGTSVRRQLAELPPITVRLTEHRLHRLRCPDCGRTTRAELPPGIPAGAFGPRLEAAIATLSIRNRLSRRQLVELVEELFGCRLASGTVDAILARTAAALDAAYDNLLEDVRAAPAVNIDETGWRLKGTRRTLWGALTARAAVFRIAPDRHERELLALLGEDFAGIGCSDRWWAYNALGPPERRQVCWAHLMRDFTAHSEGLTAQKEFGEAGLRIARDLFVAWRRFQQDADRPALKHAIAPLKRELRWLLATHAHKRARHRHTRTFAKNLLKLWPALWTFSEIDGVEPTNNAAERGLRGAAIYRKLSLGSQSEHGERTTERLLSVSQTCRLQSRSLFAYLSDVLDARAHDLPVPLLS